VKCQNDEDIYTKYIDVLTKDVNQHLSKFTVSQKEVYTFPQLRLFKVFLAKIQ